MSKVRRGVAGIRRRAVLAGLATLAGALSASASTSPVQVLHRIAISGTDQVRALATGPEGRHVYAAAGEEIRSFDERGTAVSTVKLPGVVTGLAAGAGDRLYAVVKAPARLVILGVRPLHVLTSVALPAGAPSAVLFDSIANQLFVESRAGHSVTRLDPGTGRRLGVARLAGVLAQMAANGRGTLYVANSARDSLDVVSADGMTLSGEIPLPGCRAPSGLAMDPLGRRLFVGCGNGHVLIVDADLGFTFVKLPIQQSDALQMAFAFHPLGPSGWKGGVFIAGGKELHTIRMDAFVHYANGGKLVFPGTVSALALNPAAGELWLAIESAAGAGGELVALGRSHMGGAR